MIRGKPQTIPFPSQSIRNDPEQEPDDLWKFDPFGNYTDVNKIR